ncbi:Uma2 family endonuclease [Siccirubricoccus sp. G192]|uniref:Uma2 family endonuclease n=1 Tax=Siccirubricoccus sp. G192 TaxID=2849651 RepID=UPI001C2C694D|nr:Uma2 family endonuclease [Siccirubricoccus sp. G192]MBV1796576.1 Uma2 family endonuclease [Siccirubricoccus sp. G192]
MGAPQPKPILILDRAQYRRWVEARPHGRFERVAGEVVAMAPERAAHNRLKAAVWLALREAIRAAGAPCEALTDGITVEIDDDTDYEPDAIVNCGPRMPDEAVTAPNPVIVVEVLSPSSRSVDAGAKLADYFRVPSIQHYLILRTGRREVIHHRRREDGGIETRTITEGPIELAPPGIAIIIEGVYAG